MKKSLSGKHLSKSDGQPTDSRAIDARYGLEPVIEPGLSTDGGANAAGLQFLSVDCPYCGESFETAVDTSSGSASYVEDCQVCCQPIEFHLEVDAAGALQSLSTSRSD